MDSKHTPGPWSVTDCRHQKNGHLKVFAALGSQMASVFRTGPNPDDDARLISAAPNLLEALTFIRATLLKEADSAYVPTLGELVSMLDKADAAIAAANGTPAPIEASQAGGHLPDGVAPTTDMSGRLNGGDTVKVALIIDASDFNEVFLGHSGRITGVHSNYTQRDRYGSYAYDVQFANAAGYLWQKELVLVEPATTTGGR